MKTMNRCEAARFLAERDGFCILTHRRPDGDTTGSAAALCLGLRQLGKRAFILENPELTLSELAEEFDPPVSKSCLNHRLRKILELAKGL